jgi:hypothetical protein
MRANVNHAKLVNFRPTKVRGLLWYNAVLNSDRFSPQWHDSAWRPLTPRCQELRQHLADLLADWGTHLDFRLYKEALVFFCGGEATCVKRVPLVHQGCELGTHAVNAHADGLAFMVTAFPDPNGQCEPIQRLREITGRHGIQWMNLNKRDVQLVTIR